MDGIVAEVTFLNQALATTTDQSERTKMIQRLNELRAESRWLEREECRREHEEIINNIETQ